MDDDQGDPNETDPRRIYISDEVVDRIYDAAHFLPASTEQFGERTVTRMAWHRKAYIAKMLQAFTAQWRRGVSRQEAVDDENRYRADHPYDGEQEQAEMSRIFTLILDEVFGPEGES